MLSSEVSKGSLVTEAETEADGSGGAYVSSRREWVTKLGVQEPV